MYLVTLVYGGYLIANNEMSTADLAMYALYIGIFISPIQILVELMEMMQKGLSGFRRFLDVMETEPEIQDAPDAVELKDVKGRVCYEDVSFHYSDDETTVLSRIDRDSCWKVSCIGLFHPAVERQQSVPCCLASTT